MRGSTYKKLTKEEQAELISRTRAGDIEARNRLVLAYLPLARKLAARYGRLFNIDDVMQEAIVGLIKAAERFDPERSDGFASCATLWIRATLNDYARTNARLVSCPSTDHARRTFWADLRAGTFALDTSLNADVHGDRALQDTLADPDSFTETDIAETMDLDRERRALRAAAKGLTDREREIVLKRHLCDDACTLKELATRFGISVERVRQIEEEALLKLFVAMKAPVQKSADVRALMQNVSQSAARRGRGQPMGKVA